MGFLEENEIILEPFFSKKDLDLTPQKTSKAIDIDGKYLKPLCVTTSASTFRTSLACCWLGGRSGSVESQLSAMN